MSGSNPVYTTAQYLSAQQLQESPALPPLEAATALDTSVDHGSHQPVKEEPEEVLEEAEELAEYTNAAEQSEEVTEEAEDLAEYAHVAEEVAEELAHYADVAADPKVAEDSVDFSATDVDRCHDADPLRTVPTPSDITSSCTAPEDSSSTQPRAKKSCLSVLGLIGETRFEKLTPREKILVKELRKLRKAHCELKYEMSKIREGSLHSPKRKKRDERKTCVDSKSKNRKLRGKRVSAENVLSSVTLSNTHRLASLPGNKK